MKVVSQIFCGFLTIMTSISLSAQVLPTDDWKTFDLAEQSQGDDTKSTWPTDLINEFAAQGLLCQNFMSVLRAKKEPEIWKNFAESHLNSLPKGPDAEKVENEKYISGCQIQIIENILYYGNDVNSEITSEKIKLATEVARTKAFRLAQLERFNRIIGLLGFLLDFRGDGYWGTPRETLALAMAGSKKFCESKTGKACEVVPRSCKYEHNFMYRPYFDSSGKEVEINDKGYYSCAAGIYKRTVSVYKRDL